MGKHQRRRSISTPGHLYERLRAQCERDGFPVAAVVQGLIEQYLALRDPELREMARIRDDLLNAMIEEGHAVRPAGSTSVVHALGALPSHDVSRGVR